MALTFPAPALLALAGLVALATAPTTSAAAEREVIFMLDVSGSMPTAYRQDGRFGSYDEVVAAAADKARGMLEPYRDDDELVVSFYLFGDLDPDTQEPAVRAVRERLPPDQAISFVDAFFLPERDEATGDRNYADPWTYVAASVYDVVADRLGQESPCDPLVLREDQPALSIFALTDVGRAGGGEDAPDCTKGSDARCAFVPENERRIAWLARSALANSLSYTHWNMGADNVSLIPPSQAVYRVSWVSKKKGQFNLADPELDTTPTLPPLQPHLRMVREAVQPTAEFIDTHPELVCRARDVASPVVAAAATVPVDVEARWRLKDGGEHPGQHRFDGLSLALPARGLQGLAIAPDTLRPDTVGTPQLVIPGDAQQLLALGDHDLALSRAPLCDALTSTYANSTFLLPAQAPMAGARLADGPCRAMPAADGSGDQLAAIATIELASRDAVPEYHFDLRAEGIAATAPVKLSFDRWLRLGPDQDRRVQLAAAEGTDASFTVAWELRVQRDGEPVGQAFDDVASFGDGRTRLEGVPGDQSVLIQLPGKEQARCPFSTDCPTAQHAGNYGLELCAQVDVAAPQPHRVVLGCEGCGEVRRSGPATQCVTLPVQIERRPLSWCLLAVLAALTGVALYVAAAIWWRPRFPTGLLIGTNALNLSAATERDLSITRADWWRRFTRALKPRFSGVPRGLGKLMPWAWLDWSRGPDWYLELSLARKGAVPGVLATAEGLAMALGVRAGSRGVVQLWLARLVQPGGDSPPFEVWVRAPGSPRFEQLPLRQTPPPSVATLRRDQAVTVSLMGTRQSLELELRQGGEVRQSWELKRVKG